MFTRKIALVLLVVVLMLLAAAPFASAQDFTGDKVVLGENFVLRSGESLDGSLAVLGGNAIIEEGSTVRGDVTLAGGSLDLAGEVQGNVGLFGGNALLRSTAVVTGDLAAFGASVIREDGAVVRGDNFEGLRGRDWPLAPDFRGEFTGPTQRARSGVESFFLWQLGTFGLAIFYSLLGVLLVALAPRAMQRLTTTITTQTALSFGVGFLTFIVALLAGAILLIACGLGLLVWLALLAASVLGWLAVALWLGWAILRALKVRTPSSLVEVVLGAFIIAFLTRLPWCGFLFALAGGSIGLGAVVLTRFGTRDADGRSAPPPVLGAPRPGSSDWALVPVAPAPLATVEEEPAIGAPNAGALIAGATLGAAEEAPAAGLEAISGLTPELVDRLAQGGITTPAALAEADIVRLAELTGVPVGQILIEDWIGQAARLA